MLREMIRVVMLKYYARKIKESRDMAEAALAQADVFKRRALWWRGQAAYYSAKRSEL